MGADTDFLAGKRHRDDILATWESRILLHTKQYSSTQAVILSMLAHTFDAEVIMVLMRVTFPEWKSIIPPFIASAAKIDKRGRIVADIVDRNERMRKNCVLFKSLKHLQDNLRRLSDDMKLSDQERLEFFTVAKRWVVADRRLDPNMDPRDPDARRLTVH